MLKGVLIALMLIAGEACSVRADVGPSVISADSVQLVSVSVVRGIHRGEMLSWKQYATVGFQAVVILDSVRYTIYVSNASGTVCPGEESLSWISIWERHEGTTSRDSLITWSDQLFDGTVNWAHDGVQAHDFDQQVCLVAARAHFQRLHNEAIRKLARFFTRE